jgi:hypothetical protein
MHCCTLSKRAQVLQQQVLELQKMMLSEGGVAPQLCAGCQQRVAALQHTPSATTLECGSPQLQSHATSRASSLACSDLCNVAGLRSMDGLRTEAAAAAAAAAVGLQPPAAAAAAPRAGQLQQPRWRV